MAETPQPPHEEAPAEDTSEVVKADEKPTITEGEVKALIADEVKLLTQRLDDVVAEHTKYRETTEREIHERKAETERTKKAFDDLVTKHRDLEEKSADLEKSLCNIEVRPYHAGEIRHTPENRLERKVIMPTDADVLRTLGR